MQQSWAGLVAGWNLFVGVSGPALERIIHDSHIVGSRDEHQCAKDHERYQPVSIGLAVEMAQ